MAKISGKLSMLRRTYPRVTEGGYLFQTDVDLTRRFKRAVLWLLVKDETRMGLRSLDFRRKTAGTFEDWAIELPARYQSARNNLIATMNRRHGGVWSVSKIVGWAGGRDAVRNADRTKPHGARNRT